MMYFLSIQDVVDGLSAIGHTVAEFAEGGSVISVVAREANGTIFAAHDFRKHGQSDGF